jgi:hypothetical protein
MREDNYTSLPLSRLLAEAGFKGEVEITTRECDLGGPFHKHNPYDCQSDSPCENCQHFKDEKCINVPRYDILNDLCVRYAEEFFYRSVISHCCEVEAKLDGERKGLWICSGCDVAYKPSENAVIDASHYHPLRIIQYLQQGKKQEAEDYIIANSTLGLDNK